MANDPTKTAITVRKTRGGRVQIEMTPEQARLLWRWGGNTAGPVDPKSMDKHTAAKTILYTSCKEIEQIRTLCTYVYSGFFKLCGGA